MKPISFIAALKLATLTAFIHAALQPAIATEIAPEPQLQSIKTEPLGRLFFTPERRLALERQRLLNTQETQSQLTEDSNLTIDGLVRRSSGKSTTWINGAAQHDNAAPTGVRVDVEKSNPGKITIRAGEEAPASLKVGETFNRATQETQDGIPGKIRIHRLKTEATQK